LFSRSVRNADIVHNPFPSAPPVKVPLVVTVHDAGFALFPESYPRRGLRFHQRALERTSERADLVITVSQAALEEVAAHSPISRDRLRVVYQGVDHQRAAAAEIEPVLLRHRLADAPYVLWVGSLEPRKNVDALVKAFLVLAESNAVPHRLVLVGPLGWLHQGLISDRERGLLGDRLRALGAVSDDELRALYAGADLFAFPSLHEGFGLPVLEAMAQGTPVACSDIAALAEVSGGASVLLPPTDIGAWATAIADITSDAARRATLAAAGYERAGQFSWERTARETHAIYEELVGGAP
jgi:glycosyltransferase involved in cell wall biosynthesis